MNHYRVLTKLSEGYTEVNDVYADYIEWDQFHIHFYNKANNYETVAVFSSDYCISILKVVE